jgi:hypothetical protein
MTERKRSAKDQAEQLRESPTMAHLLDALEQGKDIGHYGRLVFAMVANHFMGDEHVVAWLTKDKDFGEEQARAMVAQVSQRGYSPPRREKILEYQKEQDFPIIPNPDDPDSGNLYRELQFPQELYDHINEYYEEKAEARD